MPSNWYAQRDNMIKDDDDPEIAKQKEFNLKIVAAKKPYFMTYVYPRLKSENNTYLKNNNLGSVRRFNQYGINSIEDLERYENKTDDMVRYLEHYYRRMLVGNNPCVVNRISWIFEEAFNRKALAPDKKAFDYSILKCGTEYSKDDFKKISVLYKEYTKAIERLRINNWALSPNNDDFNDNKTSLRLLFQKECESICPNEDELCDIVLDICYSKENSKQFAWEICGEKIIQNLLKRNDNIIHYPKMVPEHGEFTYCGKQFIMCEKEVDE